MFDTGGLLEDIEHLKCLESSFLSQVDLLLCVSDGSNVVGFPVHTAIISSHSPVLAQCLHELNKDQDTTKQRLPLFHFPMVDDDCSAVRDMLACMYGRLPRANSQQAAPRVSLASQNLKNIPVEARKMRLTHKYGMLAIMQEQESVLLPALYQLTHAIGLVTQAEVRYSHHQQCALVLETVSAAEECKSAQILAVCEAFIVKHFDEFTNQSYVLSNKLSSASLLRVAQAVSMYKENTISALGKALQESKSEAQIFSKTYFQQGMICPRCNQHLDRSNKRNACHLNRSSLCKWPGGHAHPPVLSIPEISKTLLQLLEASTDAK